MDAATLMHATHTVLSKSQEQVTVVVVVVILVVAAEYIELQFDKEIVYSEFEIVCIDS